MKKALSTLVALLMVTGIAAGCSSQGGSVPETTDGAPNVEPGDASEKIKIEMMAASWAGGGWADNNHPTIQYINEKFNVDLQMQWIPNANFYEKLNVIAASGQFPDVIRIDSPGVFMQWAEQGALLDLSSDLSDYPTLQGVATPEEWQLLNPEGRIFGIPIYNTAQNTIYVREDWMKKLGIELPGEDEFTIEKFYEIAKAFTEQDPDGNGQRDTFGFSALGNSSNLGIPELLAAFGIANGWKEQNGELIPMQAQAEEWKKFLSFMNTAYNEGVLDQDFITNTNFNEKYAQGKVGFADMHFQFSQNTNKQLQSFIPGAAFVELSPPIGEDGSRGNNTPTSGMIKVVLTKNVDEKKRERILQLFDWWMSPEGEDIIKNGIEGAHYKKNADDSYEMTEALQAEGEGRQSLLWNWVLRSNSNRFNIYKWSDPEWAAKMEQSIVNAKKYPYKNAADEFIVSSPAYTEKGSALNQKFQNTVIEIIAGKKPVDTIDDAIQEWKQGGGDQIIEEINAAYKAK
ncbi:extracellular solute-binding protein [Paenibacillus sp.]|uniref:extracellular solute-binding protein n=1 Tax=Paenibacillus sp. TaxID=58172 RepID=UPI0028124399|nr:extracellular solute-binding protein [Paenibacillus sp.]